MEVADTSTKIPVSVLIPTRNEHLRLERTLRACAAFSEVWVVDSESSDDTAEIARRNGARVVNYTWNGRYPKKKQWALDNLPFANDWVLLLDADELPDHDLQEEIRLSVSEDNSFGAFDVHLEYHFTGRTLRHGYQVTKRVLVHRGRARFPEVDDLSVAAMGEQEGHYQPVTSWRSRTLISSLTHDDVSPLSSWLARHNRYSDWEAYLLANPSAKQAVTLARSKNGRAFAKVPFKPLLFFGYSFVARRGFLDGRAGFNYAFALSFYYWLIGEKARELTRDAL